MRWDNLFDDLEGQLEQEISAEEQDVHAEEERLRLGGLRMADRLRALHAAGASPLITTMRSGIRLVLKSEAFGRDWFSADVLEGPVPRGHCIVPLAAVAAVSLAPNRVAASLAPPRAAAAGSSLTLRLGLPFILRDLCRRRRAIDLVTAALTAHGTIDRVGSDHLDLAVHEPDSSRRASQVAEVLVVPLSQVVLVVF